MAQPNMVMRAKRTTGPTPNKVLCTKVACETCDHCNKAPLRTITRADGTIARACVVHLNGAQAVKVAAITSRGWRPDWMS